MAATTDVDRGLPSAVPSAPPQQPRLFISTVSPEFRILRGKIAEVVRHLGYEPVTMDLWSTASGELRAWLRQQIDSCHGLIHLPGLAYGAEPTSQDPTAHGLPADAPRYSYTQYEFLYAETCSLKTWVILPGPACTRDTPVDQLDLPKPDPAAPEAIDPASADPAAAHPLPAADPLTWQSQRRRWQAAWIQRLKDQNHVRHQPADDKELQILLLTMRDHAEEMRGQFSQWQDSITRHLAAAQKRLTLIRNLCLAALLLLGVAVPLLLWLKKDTTILTTVQFPRVETKLDHQSDLLASIAADLKNVKDQAAAQGKTLQDYTPEEIETQLAALRNTPLADFRKIIQTGLDSKDLTAQANALMASGRFVEAEAKSLEAARQKTAQLDDLTGSTALDYRRAGYACYCRGDYRAALPHYQFALTLATLARFPQTWAMLQNDLANASCELGIRTEPQEGNRLVGEAVQAYRAALEVYTREALPQDWAMTQNNLAVALCKQGGRSEGADGTRLLGEAVQAYRAALEVYTREALPQQWAGTQNNLANALSDQGGRSEGAEGTRLLGEAVKAYRAVLEVYTREALPQQWAMTQNNLAIALSDQGRRSEGAEGTRLLGEAVLACRAALEVYTREALPQQWALTQHNLAIALSDQGGRSEGAEGTRLLEEAVQACRAALEVSTREALPQQWALTQNNLANALSRQGGRSEGAQGTRLLGEAVQAFRAVLEVYTREALPQQWATTQNNLGTALWNQGGRSEGAQGTRLLGEAVQAFRAALEVYTREALTQQWAMAQSNLGETLESLGDRETGERQRKQWLAAEQAYLSALEVRTQFALPYGHKQTQGYLQRVQKKLGK